MVLLENEDCLFMIFIVVRYSFLRYAIYWFLPQLVCGCAGHTVAFINAFQNLRVQSVNP
jgi:hypothetical protein